MSVAQDVNVKLVHASRGKYIRAEPISAIYEQGRVHHVGTLPTLEDQMMEITPEKLAHRKPEDSPDRVDALVWAYTELFPDVVEKITNAADLDPLKGNRRGRSWMAA